MVDVDLYEFLKKNETHLHIEDKRVTAFCCIDFRNISKFAEILGTNAFDDEGVQCVMRDGYIVVDVDWFIEDYYGHKLSDYKNCFDESDWEQYKDRLLEQEADNEQRD